LTFPKPWRNFSEGGQVTSKEVGFLTVVAAAQIWIKSQKYLSAQGTWFLENAENLAGLTSSVETHEAVIIMVTLK